MDNLITDTIDVGVGLSTDRDAVRAVKEALQEARTALVKEKISLVIVFSTIDLAFPATTRTIAGILGDVPIIGCTGAAILSNKGVFGHGLAIMLLSFSQTTFFNSAFVHDIRTKGALEAGQALGEKLLHNFHGTRRDFGLVFSDGMIKEGWNIIHGLQERLGTSFPLIGAFASDNLRFSMSFVYFNQELHADAACGIVWGSRLHFGWGMKHGWKPLGKLHHVTRSTANIVHEIDGLPAVKIYEGYMSGGKEELKKELRRISVFYPMGIRLPGVPEYLLRNIKSIEEDGSLVFQGNIPEGSPIRLMIGTKESCLEATQQALHEAKGDFLLTQERKPALALVFDSVSRYILLGREADKELKIIKEELGKDTPVIGVYTYGEQAPLRLMNYQGKTYFHNQTITVLTIGG